jgi:DNA sulfur modification protein DndC
VSNTSFFENNSLKDLVNQVQEVYLADNRPWVVGYSGGKDSTAVVQLVFLALSELPIEKRKKDVFVISSDTLVETPIIVDHIFNSSKQIHAAAAISGLPIKTEIVKPDTSETFWVNLLGKGYPAPTKQFRWCTDRMKIKPANRFILDRVAEHGEVVVVLGVRSSESATRQASINLHKLPGQLLSRHSTLPNAFVYSPIVDFLTEDVWSFLLQHKNPWGADNNKLLTLYRNAQQGECPLVIDNSTQSCGNSRFGCWTCTVVKSDKSMSALIDNGEEWMEPLLEFRDLLASTSDPEVKEKYREFKRRDGKVMLKNRDEEDDGIIYGPYKFEYRKEFLTKLLTIQKTIKDSGKDFELISRAELSEIRRIWKRELQDWADSVNLIFESVFGFPFEQNANDSFSFTDADLDLLKDVCKQHNISWQMVAKLIDTEREYDSLSRRSKIYGELKSVLSESWGTQKEEVQRIKEKEQLRFNITSATDKEVVDVHQ